MPQGYLCFVLHAHLPYVRHPEHEASLEERWFYEALTETYLPLIDAFDELIEQEIPFRLVFSTSPTLLSMLEDEFLQARYLKHLNKLLELADQELHRTKDSVFQSIALMYQQRLIKFKQIFTDKYQCNLIRALQKFRQQQRLELITCAATHGFLPLLMNQPETVRAQIAIAVDLFNKHFGSGPPGLWLPECAYTHGIDNILKDFGIKYFFTDSHGILFASHRPKYNIFAPIYCPSGVAVFGRDVESSKQVWSSTEGYPGDYNYREYYRDIGHELDYDYIYPYIHPEGIRINTGFKYYRITGRNNEKEPYQRELALHQAHLHAGNFLFNREHQVRHLTSLMDRTPIIVAPYDAELFGHWWFEGPDWLKAVLHKIHTDFPMLTTITPGDYLKAYPCNQMARPCPSTWGDAGYNKVWLSPKNDWIYRHLHHAGEGMTTLVQKYPGADDIMRRAIRQAARELLLAQSSDWAFIMNTGTMVEYAVRRTKQHIKNFLLLEKQIKNSNIDQRLLGDLEYTNNIFPDLNIHHFSKTS